MASTNKQGSSTQDNKQQATNDNSRRLAGQAGSSGAGSGSSAPQVPPPLRRPRPARPNIRRQIIVGAPGSAVDLGAPPPLQLAGMPAPQRPAHLPARFDAATYVRRPPTIVTTAGHGSPAGSKPNRYAWAQLQRWQAAAAANQQSAHLGSPAHAGPQQHHHGFHHHFAAPFSAASRIMVVNPTQIVNLGAHTKSRLIKCIEAVKRFSEKWFSHVLLLLFLAIYACFGAYIFISFEASTEAYEKQLIIDTRLRILNETYDAAKDQNRDEFLVAYQLRFIDYERLLNRACASGMTSSSLENQWNFWGALFYSMTVFTTIGYGHLTPITFGGRVATMVYAIFGIPILLMVLADLGKLLTRVIKYAFKKFRYLFNKLMGRKTTIRTRQLISDNTNQYIGVARGAFERGFAYIQPSHYYGTNHHHAADHMAGQDSLQGNVQVGGSNNDAGANNQAGNNKSNSFASRLLQFRKNKLKLNTKVPSDIDEQTISIEEQIEAGKAQRPDTMQKTKGSQKTDVIVTPVKQTKPVSPKVDEKKSLADHQRHHSGSRAQSPGLNSGSARGRKISNTGSSSQKRTQTTNPGAKGSVSRSSSSSIVATTPSSAGGDKSKMADAVAPKAEQEQMSGTEEDVEEAGVLSDAESYEDIVDEFDIPVSFALFLLVTYMMIGAVIFSIWEGWQFFDALYFVFISMSTIGFGDLVPQHPKRMIGTFIYLLFGLALTSMCINVVQEKIHATFLRAKMQIGEKMGLDLEQIMADDYYDGMDGDEEDSNSVSLSQTNSSAAHMAPGDCDNNNSNVEGSGDSRHHHHSGKSGHHGQSGQADGNADSFKLSRSGKEIMGSSRRRAATGLPGHNNNNGSFKRKSSKKITRQNTPSSLMPPSERYKTRQPQVPAEATVTAAAAALLPATVAIAGDAATTPAVTTAAAAAAAQPMAVVSQKQPQQVRAALDNASDAVPDQTLPMESPTLVPDSSDAAAVAATLLLDQQEPLKSEIEVVRKVEQLSSSSNPLGIVHPAIGLMRSGICEPLTTPLRRFNASAAHFFEKHHPARLRATISGTNRSQTPVFKSLSSGSPKTNLKQNGDNYYNTTGGRHSNGRSSARSPSAHSSPRHRSSADRTGARSSGSSRRSSVSHELNELDDLILALSSKSPSERYGPLLGIPNLSGRSTRSNSPSNTLAKRGISMTNRPPPMSFDQRLPKKRSLANLMPKTPMGHLYDSRGRLNDLEIKFARAEMIP